MKKIHSLTKREIIADQCFVAEHFFDRLKGLIGKKAMKPGEAMFFPRCNDIHMWWMSISIDVVFLRLEKREEDTIFRVCSVHEQVQPWRVLPLWDRKATETLELPTGTIRRCEIRVGDELCLS